MQPGIRPYRPGDLPAVYDICVRTGAAGGDARGRYSCDRLLGDVYAAPYVTLEPAHAAVLDDGTGTAVGYVLGTADTVDFVRRYRADWLPAAAGRYRAPADPPGTEEDVLLAALHRPERMLRPELADWPAHLHIDILPAWQGRGWGRALIVRFLAGVRAAGAPAVHLGVAATNRAARAFYERLGFVELPVHDPGATYLGRDTARHAGTRDS